MSAATAFNLLFLIAVLSFIGFVMRRRAADRRRKAERINAAIEKHVRDEARAHDNRLDTW